MPGITGMGTTFNLENYVGELYAVSREDTPLLSAIGGLTGGLATQSTEFEWQHYDLRDPDANRQRVEGATAPEAEARTRYNARNVVEIHQETVDISYTKQGAIGNRATTQAGQANPMDELGWQVTQALKQVARDVESSFILGEYQNPTDNTLPRKTRGLLQAIQTNVRTTEHTAKTLTEDDVLDLMQMAWDNGGIRETETRTIVVNSTLKRALTRIFIADRNYQEQTRNVGGVSLQTIETDFGRFNIMLDPYVPKDKMLVLSLEQLAPRFLEIPGKGYFFAEPLAKVGASDRVMLYGEIGLQYGNERAHAVLTVDGASNVPVESVALGKQTMTVHVGATNTVSASLSPFGATNQKVTWSSEDDATATVAADKRNPLLGVVTGIKEGSTTVKVTTEDGSKTDSVAVTVAK